MTVNDDRSARAVRCPSCGARNLAGASWCSLCFVPIGRTEPAPAEVASPAEPGAADVTDGGPGEQPEPPAVDVLLAELAVHERRPSRLDGVSELVSSSGARVVVMLLGTVLVTAAGFGLMAAIGSLL